MLTERYGHNTYSYYLKYSEWHLVQVFRPRSVGKREDDKINLCTAILLWNIECRVTFAPLCTRIYKKKVYLLLKLTGKGVDVVLTSVSTRKLRRCETLTTDGFQLPFQAWN